MKQNTMAALTRNFLGNSPIWYKQLIIFFLFINPILLHTVGPVVTGWILILALFLYVTFNDIERTGIFDKLRQWISGGG